MLTVLVCLRRQITAGYYMKILHLFSKSTLNLSESGLPLKCLLKYFFFFKSLLTISCKSIFYVSAVNYYCTYIFKASNCKFLVLFSEHNSSTAILTQASVTTCNYNFYSFSCISFTCLDFTISFLKD